MTTAQPNSKRHLLVFAFQTIHNIGKILAAALFGAAAAWATYFPIYRGDLPERAKTLLWLGVFTLTAFLAYWGIFYFARRRFAARFASPKTAPLLLLGMLLAGTLLALAYPVFPAAHSEQYLLITALGEKNPRSSGSEVRLEGLYGWHNEPIAFSEFRRIGKKGDWRNQGGHFVADQTFPAKIRWKTDWLYAIKLNVFTLPSAGKIELVWNDRAQVVDLYSSSPAVKEIWFQPSFPFYFYAGYVLAFGLVTGLLLYLTLAACLRPAGQSAARQGRRPGRAGLLAYSLPLLAVWGVYWLAFWPGMRSPDSSAQLSQAASGIYNDWHPVFHTWTLWLIMKVWDSPAAITLVQVIALAVTAAVGYLQLARWGVPRRWRLIGLGLFAISIVNSLMVVIIWKDILFAIAMLAFFVYWVDLTATGGREKRSFLYWAGFFVTMLLASLYRHNGLSVVLLSIPLLILCFKPLRKPAGILLLIFIPLVLFLKGPFVTMMNVRSEAGSFAALFETLNVAAHVAAGEEFAPQDQAYLNSILPYPEGWEHNCHIPFLLIFKEEYHGDVIAQNPQQLHKIFFSTLRRAPRVNLDYLICTSSLIWRISNTSVFYITPMENPSIHRQTKLPEALAIIYRVYYRTLRADLINWVWRPAFFMYLFLFGVIVKAVNNGKRYLLLAVPVLSLSIPLAFFINGQDFRYLYAVYLISVLYWPYLFFSPNTDEGSLEAWKTTL